MCPSIGHLYIFTLIMYKRSKAIVMPIAIANFL